MERKGGGTYEWVFDVKTPQIGSDLGRGYVARKTFVLLTGGQN